MPATLPGICISGYGHRGGVRGDTGMARGAWGGVGRIGDASLVVKCHCNALILLKAGQHLCLCNVMLLRSGVI